MNGLDNFMDALSFSQVEQCLLQWRWVCVAEAYSEKKLSFCFTDIMGLR
ncbi:hypothetical protein S7335_2959 [Synechococcus sp. PCC 7335]|nr:hypothetical protein S7335_2959 [Synechococcus sp. PCC 7335]